MGQARDVSVFQTHLSGVISARDRIERELGRRIMAWLVALAIVAGASRSTLGQARVVSAPSEPSLLNLTTGWARASVLGDLREMRAGPGHLELRVWRGFGPAETELFVLRRADGHWSAFFARVIRCELQVPASARDTASATTMRAFVAQARRNCGTSIVDVSAGARIITADTLVVQRLDVSEADVETAWTDAEKAGVVRLPGRVKHSATTTDGTTYVIEVRRGDEYRAAEIEHVERAELEADSQVEQAYAAVRRLRP
jgi:hypothetical protein